MNKQTNARKDGWKEEEKHVLIKLMYNNLKTYEFFTREY